jgi:hypothetical protein
MNLDKIFDYTPATCASVKSSDRIRAAHKAYAEALLSDRVMNDEGELTLELAYEDIIRVYRELTPSEAPETERAIQLINEAYDLAVDPDRAIVLLVQGASYFANAAVALSKD